jgi:hypothetical protein
MPSSTRIVAAVLLAAAVTAPSADAAPKRKPAPPKPACNLVVDPANDAGVFGGAANPTTYDTNLDIVGADVASNAKNISVLFRLKDLTEQDPLAPTGRMWTFGFTHGNNSVAISAYVSPVGTFFSSGTGKVDYALNTVQVDVPLSTISYAKIAKGSVLKTFYVTSNPVVGLDPSLGAGNAITPPGAADEAKSGASYAVGHPSCVKVPA